MRVVVICLFVEIVQKGVALMVASFWWLSDRGGCPDGVYGGGLLVLLLIGSVVAIRWWWWLNKQI